MVVFICMILVFSDQIIGTVNNNHIITLVYRYRKQRRGRGSEVKKEGGWALRSRKRGWGSVVKKGGRGSRSRGWGSAERSVGVGRWPWLKLELV